MMHVMDVLFMMDISVQIGYPLRKMGGDAHV
jgi:hypothetical protein